MIEHRYPLAALAAVVGIVPRSSRLARLLRISGTSLARFNVDGLTAVQAERYAVRAGCHPFEVWPEMADHEFEATSKPCDHCGDPFVPMRPTGRFCSPRCNRRWWSYENRKRKMARDPEYRERLYACRRAYYQECGEYERARQHRYDIAKRAEKRAAA